MKSVVKVLRDAPHFDDEAPYKWEVWESKIDGSFVDVVKPGNTLKVLIEKGITDQIQNQSNNKEYTSNIGFNPSMQKWCGWSHRALFGFGIGSVVSKGDIAFIPKNKEDEVENILDFWEDTEGHQLDFSYIEVTDPDQGKGLQMTWKYSDTVPNKKLRGTIGERFTPFRKEYGKGEWTALTLEDAKQMAKDFAKNIS